MLNDGKRALLVGVVDYLNSRPLAWDFLNGKIPPGFSVRYLPPANLAEQLGSGQLDVGLVPTIELQRIRDLVVIPGPCVASSAPVRSVVVVTNVEPRRIRRLALDENSRTSVALAKIILAERYGVEPRCVSRPARLGEMLTEADAALVIGDPALVIRRTAGNRILDLAEEWRILTGLPFVFAVWAGRRQRLREEVATVLRTNLEHGLAALPAIASRAAAEMSLDAADLLRYLTENLSYEFGREERRGIETFFRKAADMKLIREVLPLEFWDGEPC